MSRINAWGMTTMGRIMSASSCLRMWQWNMYRPAWRSKQPAMSTSSAVMMASSAPRSPGLTRKVSFQPASLASIVPGSSGETATKLNSVSSFETPCATPVSR